MTVYHPETCICDNCGKRWSEYELKDIQDYCQRVGAGCQIDPSGECPECGSLCYPEREVKALEAKNKAKSDAQARLAKAIKAWEKASEGDSSDAESDAGFELATAAKALLKIV